MKLKSLLLGSVAAAGLSTSAFAADLNVLPYTDVCDLLGISGLTISSDTNCLQISGHVDYQLDWGNYNGTISTYQTSTVKGGHNNGMAPAGAVGTSLDWASTVDAWLKFVGTADSDFGPASATIKLWYDDDKTVKDEGATSNVANANAMTLKEAYVSVGSGTVLMAGKKGSIANFGDDTPLNYLGTFMSSDNSTSANAGAGVAYDWSTLKTGGHVIQVVSDLGNGFSVGAGLENLNTSTPANAGTLVGVVSYKGDNVSAHLTVLGGGVLDGTVEDWAAHAGVTATFNNFKVRAAGVYDDNAFGVNGFFEGMASAEATFDMFTLAASVDGNNANELGFGVSGAAKVTDGVSINLGFRWHDNNTTTANSEVWQTEAQLIAAVTDTLKLTGAVGMYGETNTNTSLTYGKAELGWNPGGGFTSSVGGQYYSNGAYKTTFKAAKTFN